MALYDVGRISRKLLGKTRDAFIEYDEQRNQQYEFQQKIWDPEQQQSKSMPNNFSRPLPPNHPSCVQGYKGRAHTPPASIAKSVAEKFLRFCQFALALTVAGLYGQDLHHACDKNVYLDAKWVFAEIVAALASATAAGYLLIWCCVQRLARPALTSYYSMHFPLFLWEIVMCLIWMIVFGIFGKMYLPEHPEGDLDIVRMKHACWVDLVNLLLWAATMIWSGLRWWQGRIRKSKERGESAAAGVRDPSEAMKELKFGDGSALAGAPSGTPAGAGAGGHAAPPVASGAAPVATSANPASHGTSRAVTSDAAQHDAAPVVSRQNSRESAYESSEERVVSP